MSAGVVTAAAGPGRARALDPQLFRIRDSIYQTTGMFQPDHTLRLLEERVMRRMQAIQVRTLREYREQLSGSPTAPAEVAKLLQEIRDGSQGFFRHPEQLQALRKIVLPRLVLDPSRKEPRTLRIWSAGCSTGEDAYTLAMVLMEESADRLKEFRCEVLATDADEAVLERARAGIYDDPSASQLTPHLREKYFTPLEDRWQVTSPVKAQIKFSQFHLLRDSPTEQMKGIDVIFCKDVLIYLDGLDKRRILHHFSRSLLPHGYIFLGSGESLHGIQEEFHLVHLPSTIAYVRPNSTLEAGN